MRDYIFRGKHAWGDSYGWIYGSLIKAGTYCCILDPDDEDDMDFPYLDDDLGTIDGKAIPVDPETVGQWTGLCDKNGKRIFEGDVIKFHAFHDEPDWIGTVTYDERLCLYLLVGIMPYCGPFEVQVSSKDKTTFEVLGNRLDNPELVKEN